MHTFVDLYFATDGASPFEVSDRLKAAVGVEFIIGPHDVAFEWHTVEEFRTKLDQIHHALKGTGVIYHVETISDEPGFIEPVTWPPPMVSNNPAHPGY
jgi:hypothetical protein